ncbi:MAG TPA: hypothetical protein VHV08_00235 [Pirellulales bacterium]|jgi:hypothetical protein|nr:hypothetical protein [Pirellulales bacterium]
MEINRNQYFMIGLVILLLGLQLRSVETYVLNEKASRFIAERLTPAVADADGSVRPFVPVVGSTPRRTLRPPTWLGYAIMSVGAVLVLHSLAMKRPGG